ncbi:hypothetical protein D9M73_156880 [compost metagenome]
MPIPLRTAWSKSSKLYWPMPLAAGVMLVEYTVPIGVSIGNPPAKGLPSLAVWQATQSPARARYSPRRTCASSFATACAAAPAPSTRVAINSVFMLIAPQAWTNGPGFFRYCSRMARADQ